MRSIFSNIIYKIIIIFLGVFTFWIISIFWFFNNFSFISIFLFVLLGFTNFWIIFIEFNIKIISVCIKNKKFEIKNFIGLGNLIKINIDEEFYYKLSIIGIENKPYEYLNVYNKNIVILTINEYYHKNYKDLKNEISKYVKYNGVEKITFDKEIKRLINK